MSVLAILFICLCMILSNFNGNISEAKTFSFEEITVSDIQIAFKQNRLSSRQLVEYYLGQIQRANPVLKGIIEVNPDALYLAGMSQTTFGRVNDLSTFIHFDLSKFNRFDTPSYLQIKLTKNVKRRRQNHYPGYMVSLFLLRIILQLRISLTQQLDL